MAAANVKTGLRSKEKSQKRDGDNESKRKQHVERPAPKTKATEPPRLPSTPNPSSDVIAPSVDDVSEALRLADLGGSEVEELLNQAYDLNRRLKAELANRLSVGGPTTGIPEALGLGQVGQPGSENPKTQQRGQVLPPLHKPNRAGGSADHCHKRPQNR